MYIFGKLSVFYNLAGNNTICSFAKTKDNLLWACTGNKQCVAVPWVEMVMYRNAAFRLTAR